MIQVSEEEQFELQFEWYKQRRKMDWQTTIKAVFERLYIIIIDKNDQCSWLNLLIEHMNS